MKKTYITIFLLIYSINTFAFDFDRATCKATANNNKYVMKHDLARGHFDINNSDVVAGILKSEAGVIVSIFFRGERINTYASPQENFLRLAQSLGPDYQAGPKVVIECDSP